MEYYFDACIEDITIPEEWEDVSYGNDACPSWLYNGYQIFIHHRDIEKRESPELNSFRYYIYVDYTRDEIYKIFQYDFWNCLDDLGQVIKFVSAPLHTRIKIISEDKSRETFTIKIDKD